jgi:hypothetical protein
MNTDYKQMPIKVADIQFAYDNEQVISLLKTRGEIIVAEEVDNDKRKAINDKIGKLLKEKPEQLKRPVCAFITFEREIGYLEALDYTKKIFTQKSWMNR